MRSPMRWVMDHTQRAKEIDLAKETIDQLTEPGGFFNPPKQIRIGVGDKYVPNSHLPAHLRGQSVDELVASFRAGVENTLLTAEERAMAIRSFRTGVERSRQKPTEAEDWTPPKGESYIAFDKPISNRFADQVFANAVERFGMNPDGTARAATPLDEYRDHMPPGPTLGPVVEKPKRLDGSIWTDPTSEDEKHRQSSFSFEALQKRAQERQEAEWEAQRAKECGAQPPPIEVLICHRPDCDTPTEDGRPFCLPCLHTLGDDDPQLSILFLGGHSLAEMWLTHPHPLPEIRAKRQEQADRLFADIEGSTGSWKPWDRAALYRLLLKHLSASLDAYTSTGR